MDAYEYSELLKLLNTKLNNIKGILKPDLLNQRLQEIIELESNQDFWNDIDNATKIGIEKNRILGKLNKFNKAYESLNGTNELYEMANSEKDEDTLELLYEEANDLEDLIKSTEISVMLSNPDDTLNAIVTIHPGAGGTESQDWASILYRMYLRWAERNDFKVEVLDYQAGDEAGIKDVSFVIRGENAYGYMKTENGIHRLVRISPFDSNAKRHTSFSSVMVSPEIDDNIDIQCQNDRSKHKNKASAMKMLKSRLYELELEKQRASKDTGDKSENGWGHQIRSYVLQPYQQVKDSRSNIGYSNVEAILDGDITKIMEDVLIATNTN